MLKDNIHQNLDKADERDFCIEVQDDSVKKKIK